MNSVFSDLDNWESTKKAFNAWGITTYIVDPDLKELRVEGNVIYILPEMESTVRELLKENTQ